MSLSELVIDLSPLSDEDVTHDNNLVGEIYSDEDVCYGFGRRVQWSLMVAKKSEW